MRALALVLLLPLLAGCLSGSDDDPDAPGPGGADQDPTPFPADPIDFEFVANGNSSAVDGLWVEDGYAYLSGPVGLRIVDVHDPANPVQIGDAVAETSSRDADLMRHPNGRLYVTLSAGNVKLVDVTDPTAPFVVSAAAVSSHNHGVVPGTTLVYNSRSISTHVPGLGETGQVDIIDFADPANPTVKVFAFPALIFDPAGKPHQVTSTTCHDMTFNAELARAYCAGVTDTTIWDVQDPANPVIIQAIDWPGTNIHHGIWDSWNGTLLIIGDEFAGAAAGPMCSSTVAYPTAGLWFYDISDISLPVPLGYFQVEYDAVQVNEGQPEAPLCTTHFGDIIDDQYLVMGWYAAGTVLIDYADPANARQAAHYRPEGRVNTWEARYHDGHVYTGDTARGMDILRLV